MIHIYYILFSFLRILPFMKLIIMARVSLYILAHTLALAAACNGTSINVLSVIRKIVRSFVVKQEVGIVKKQRRVYNIHYIGSIGT